MIDDVITSRVLQWPKPFQNQLPIVVKNNVALAPKPLTVPPAPQIASPLQGTATGFKFSFNQVAVPSGTTNTISSYRIYRNTQGVAGRILVHTIPHDPTHQGAVTFTDTIPEATGQNYYYWVSAVDTAGQESTLNEAQCGAVDGSIGSTPFSKTNGFAYTATSTSITWFWDGTNGSTTQTILRADKTSRGPISGNQTITGLTPSTTYNFYPYWDEPSQTVKWVAGGSGTPAYAQPSAGSAQLVQLQNLRNQIPFSIGGMQASTPASGTGSGSGGGGGGGGGCFSGNVRVKTSEGLKRFDELGAHIEIENRTGVHRASLIVHHDYCDDMIDMGNGELVTFGHFFLRDKECIPADSFFSPSLPRLYGWEGTVYNLHIHTDKEEDRHYILENGLAAHNAAIDKL